MAFFVFQSLVLGVLGAAGFVVIVVGHFAEKAFQYFVEKLEERAEAEEET